MHRLGEREGFIVVYPNGSGRHWDTFGGEFADDVRLILAVIDDAAAEHRIDRDRVYVTGASNGAFMTYVLACEAPETFAAAAPVMGLMQESLAQKHPDGPAVPMLIIHGTRDGLAPYNARSVLGEETFTVDEAVKYWVRRNGCNSTPTVVDLADRDPRDGTRVTVERYVGLKAPVELYRVEGGGHTWPGGREPGLGLVTGRISKDIEASDVIWEFFDRHRR